MSNKISTYYRHADDEREACWETDVWCNDGRVVIAQEDTKEESLRVALERANEHNAFLARDPKTRLKEILARTYGPNHLNAVDTTHAIKAVAELLLHEHEGNG